MAGGVLAHESVDMSGDAALYAVLESTRALLWISTAAEAAEMTSDLVAQLGGTTVPVRGFAGDAIPVDISFGAGDPQLPAAPHGTRARVLLEQHLPAFVGDAQRALELGSRTERLTEDASTDALTGLANRRSLGRLLGRLRADDTVIMLDLDHFKAVNDTLGHHEGDVVLKSLGKALIWAVRAVDHVGRYGGEEFVIILSGGDADPFLRRLQTHWETVRPHVVTFSAGVAACRPDPRQALRAADRALYRAKDLGRNQWQVATVEDYS